MIDDLPAPRDAPNILARVLVILFGRGYALVGLAIAFIVPWYLLRAWYGQTGLAQALDHPGHYWPGQAVGVAFGVFSDLLQAVVIALVALVTRQIVEDRPIDLGRAIGVVRASWSAILGVTVLWYIAQELVLVLYAPGFLGLLERTSQIFPGLSDTLFWLGVPLYTLSVIIALIQLCFSWSVVSVALQQTKALRAFVAGLTGPWRLGLRSLLVVLVAVSLHIAQVQTRLFVNAELSGFPSVIVTSVHGAIQALVTTVLTILITVALLDVQRRRTRIEPEFTV